MRNKTLIRILMATALLILSIPVVTSAQIYNRSYDRNYDRSYDRSDGRDVRDAIARLDSSSARLENDLNYGSNRRVFGGLFVVRSVDSNAIAEVRDFRQAVRELRRSSRGGFRLGDSQDEARMVIDQGIQLDRYLRVRTGSSSVDADLAEIRSNLHVIADAYGLDMRYY